MVSLNAVRERICYVKYRGILLVTNSCILKEYYKTLETHHCGKIYWVSEIYKLLTDL